jgi:hypothetical protein
MDTIFLLEGVKNEEDWFSKSWYFLLYWEIR